MKKIAIIGVGQLGSRHLQALTTIKQKIDIELVEPYEPMQKTAMERYEQMPKNELIHSITFFNDILELYHLQMIQLDDSPSMLYL